LAEIFLTPLSIEWLLKFPPHLTSASTLFGENRPSKSRVEINEKKTSTNSIYQDLWAPTASRLRRLIAIKQWWRSGMSMNSRSDWLSLGWSKAKHYRYCWQWMRKASPCLCSHNGPPFKQFCCRQL